MALLASILLASHGSGPYDWHIPCERWQTRAVEIMADENINIEKRRFLVRYLRNKVEGECPADWSSLLQY